MGNTKFNDIVTHMIDLNSINAKTVNYVLPQAGQEVALLASELAGGRNNIKLHVPPLEILAAPGDFEPRLTNVLNTSVPRALSEFGSDGAMAIEGVPLLTTAIEGILGGDQNLGKREIGPRGGGLWGWIKGAGCAVFATAAVPGYLLAAADLAVANRRGQRLNEDLLYQMWPVHGDLALSAPVTVYYQATRPPFFGNAQGITMNRDVYVILPPPPAFTWQQYKDVYPQFLNLAKLLRHELQHVKQYHESSYNLVTFAHRYLFEFCKAGGYSKNPLEIQAQEQEYGLNTNLGLYSLNVQFFLIWRTFGLVGSLGYPVEEHSHRPDDIGSPILEKNFKNGVLQTRDRETDGTYCFRTFSAEDIWNRDATCTTPTINPCNKIKKRAQDTRLHDKEGNPIGAEPAGRERCRKRKTCDQLRKEWSREWASLSKRPWRCASDVP
ncbi:MAG: hypothetical protein L6R35_007167 [Caloplaca aegaea]|nr:MAG: hypothetical protein L6R35_007167 [Caloplaca aegaea]